MKRPHRMRVRSIANIFGIDRAVLFTLIARGWSIGAGLVTIIFVTNFLSAEQQGYYYTFYSLIALQIFVELGLTFAIIQFSSHEMAHLAWNAIGTVSGDAQSKRRLQSLAAFAFTWFGAGALVLTTVLLPVGLYFFKNTAQSGSAPIDITAPWTLLVICAAVNLLTTAAAAILEGCGRVADVAILRLWQSILSTATAWIILDLGGGLFALAGNSLVVALTGAVWLYVKYRNFFTDLHAYEKILPGMNWRKEIWPFQWRIGVSWMSGFLVFQLFNPLLFATQGPVVAGQMGMSMQIFGAINGAAMAWISTKAPHYGQLIATRQRDALDKMFFRGFVQSFALLAASLVLFGVVIIYLRAIHSPYAGRVLEPYLMALLAIASLGNHIVFAEASYLRAHKEEPFMILSISSGLTTTLFAVLLIPTFGALGAVGTYVSTTVLIGVVYGTLVFYRKRKQWGLADSLLAKGR